MNCKNFIFYFIFILFSISLQSQNNHNIRSVINYIGSDTSFTFELKAIDNDVALKKLIQRLGIPETNTIGSIIWDNVSIPYIGTKLRIKIIDGVFKVTNDRAEFIAFNDNTQKINLKNTADKNTLRMTEISIFSGGKNAINSNLLEGRMISFLEGILNN